jgi:predicted metal-dependent peptidase
VKSNIIKAATIAKMTGGWGSVPGHIKLAIEKVKANKLPWNQILAKYMTAYVKENFSLQKPNRRYLPAGLYMPSLHNQHLGGVFIGMDVSGSMCEKTLDHVFAEVNHFWIKHKPEWLRLMTFDTQVVDDVRFEEGEDLHKFTYTGGGGTHVRPLLKRIRDEKPRFAIILTDGDFASPKIDDVKSDIIWVIIDSPGWKSSRAQDRVIHIESEDR